MNRIGFRYVPMQSPSREGDADAMPVIAPGIEFLVDGHAICAPGRTATGRLSFIGMAPIFSVEIGMTVPLMLGEPEAMKKFGFTSDEPGNPILVPLMAHCCWGDPYEGHLVCQIAVDKDSVSWRSFQQVEVDYGRSDDHSVVIPFKEMDEPFCETPAGEFVFDRNQYESAFMALAEFLEQREEVRTELVRVKERFFRKPKLRDYKEVAHRGVDFSEDEFNQFLAENNLN